MATTAAPALRAPGAGRSDETPAARAWRRLKRRRSAMLGLLVIVVLVAMAVLAPLVAPYDPAKQSWSA